MIIGEYSTEDSPIRAIDNKSSRLSFGSGSILNLFSEEIAETVVKFHNSFPQYKTTRLVRLKNMAEKLKLGEVLVKDESLRFGLSAFKVLGGSFAIGKLISRKLDVDFSRVDYMYLKSENTRKKIGDITFTTASDGNHGCGVAWAATDLGYKAVVYLPEGTVSSRIDAIRHTGAEVIVTDCDYDKTVLIARDTAAKNGWELVQDTAFENYTEIPLLIMQGYLTMISEAIKQMRQLNIGKPTHVFLQAGVGSMAAAVLAYLVNVYGNKYPKTVIIEPHQAACFYHSVEIGDGDPHPADGNLNTMMAGLSCGVPSMVAWDIIKKYGDVMISCSDNLAAEGMKIFVRPYKDDSKIISGESGAIGIGLLSEIMKNKTYVELRRKLNLDKECIVLLFNTEGATDPENYRKIVG